jgi:DEAD/DEAH box helicase domain-containing protein
MSDAFRGALSKQLMEHHYFREFIEAADSATLDYTRFFEKLKRSDKIFESYKPEEADLLIDSLLCLISHARSIIIADDGTSQIVPFLNVHVQLWFRELRRVVASVEKKPKLRLSDDVNDVDRYHMLPVINCRDCGAIGWVSIQGDDDSVAIASLRNFYTAFFEGKSSICTLIPLETFPEELNEQNRYYLCPECMKLNSKPVCSQCGRDEQIKVQYDRPFAETDSQKKRNPTKR